MKGWREWNEKKYFFSKLSNDNFLSTLQYLPLLRTTQNPIPIELARVQNHPASLGQYHSTNLFQTTKKKTWYIATFRYIKFDWQKAARFTGLPERVNFAWLKRTTRFVNLRAIKCVTQLHILRYEPVQKDALKEQVNDWRRTDNSKVTSTRQHRYIQQQSSISKKKVFFSKLFIRIALYSVQITKQKHSFC